MDLVVQPDVTEIERALWGCRTSGAGWTLYPRLLRVDECAGAVPVLVARVAARRALDERVREVRVVVEWPTQRVPDDWPPATIDEVARDLVRAATGRVRQAVHSVLLGRELDALRWRVQEVEVVG